MNKTMSDVRAALLALYRKLRTHDGIEGKTSEGYCHLNYPTVWEYLDDGTGFDEPCGIEIYSYALGPSRSHYINKGSRDRKVNYYTWESPDIFAKAIEVIAEWEKELDESIRRTRATASLSQAVALLEGGGE